MSRQPSMSSANEGLPYRYLHHISFMIKCHIIIAGLLHPIFNLCTNLWPIPSPPRLGILVGVTAVQEAECNPLDNSPLSELGGCYNQLGSAWRKGLISETIPQVVYKWFTCMEKRRDLSFFLYAATILKQKGK